MFGNNLVFKNIFKIICGNSIRIKYIRIYSKPILHKLLAFPILSNSKAFPFICPILPNKVNHGRLDCFIVDSVQIKFI